VKRLLQTREAGKIVLAFAILFILIPIFFLFPVFSGVYPDPYDQAPDEKIFRLQGNSFKFVKETPQFHKRHFSIFDPTPSPSPMLAWEEVLRSNHLYADVQLLGSRVVACTDNEEKSLDSDGSPISTYTDLSLIYDARVINLHHNGSSIPVGAGDSLRLFIPYYHSDSLNSRMELGEIYRLELSPSSDSYGNGASNKPWSRKALSLPCLMLSDFAITLQRYHVDNQVHPAEIRYP